MKDVVVTGIGLVTPIGDGPDAFWRSLLDGVSGAGPITAFDASALPVRIACEVTDFDPAPHVTPREAARLDRFTQMAVVAAASAWEAAGIGEIDPRRAGAVIGSGIGGLSTIEREHEAFLEGGPRRVSPFMVPKLMPNGAAGAVAMKLGIHGPNFALASACATGAHSVGEAARMVEAGIVDIMVAGGTEAAMTPLSVSSFARMGALSTRNDSPETASRPFDAERDGFVFGEGAGILILERAESAERRGAPIIGRILGYGASCDAHHATQPDPEGRGAVDAMRAAMDDARVAPDEIGYINAHGTSTPYNDRIETIAIKTALGVEAKRVPVSSTKSQTGHLLGAAGAVEAAACLLAMEHGVVPQTINLANPDPECDLDYVGDGPREEKIEVALSNSFGFGGQNACLVLGRAS